MAGSNKFTVNQALLGAYIKEIRKAATELCTSQDRVAQSFVVLGNSWSDNVYLKTGEQLSDISETKGKLYTALCKAIESVTEYHNKYVEIYELGNDHLLRVSPMAPYKKRIRKEDIMRRNGSGNDVTDLAAMEALMRDIKQYILTVDEIMSSIKRNHGRIVESRSWVAPQCDQMTEIIAAISKKMRVQLEELAFLNKYIAKKHDDIVILNKKKF